MTAKFLIARDGDAIRIDFSFDNHPVQAYEEKYNFERAVFDMFRREVEQFVKLGFPNEARSNYEKMCEQLRSIKTSLANGVYPQHYTPLVNALEKQLSDANQKITGVAA